LVKRKAGEAIMKNTHSAKINNRDGVYGEQYGIDKYY